MLQNNNSVIVRRLSFKALKYNKIKNFIIIVAIILTTILLTATLTIGMTFYNSNKLYNVVKYTGIDAEGYIKVDKNQYNKLINNKNIDKVGFSKMATLEPLQNKEFLRENIFLESVENKELYEMMAVVPIEGSYPKSAEEVLVPIWVLDVLNIPHKVGEKINLQVKVNDEIKNIELTVGGYYDPIVSRESNKTKIFVSPEFIKKYNPTIEDKDVGIAFIDLKTLNKESTVKNAEEEISKVAKEVGSTEYKVHPRFDEKNDVNVNITEQVFAISIGILLVMLSGYLIIYNIFYISVVKEIKFYGLLKTVGTTSKQIKKIIKTQAFILSIIGIPIGLILGYLLGAVLTPMALTGTILQNILIVSKNPCIFIFSALFSLITVFLGCKKPEKIASKVSPIEATKYVLASFKISHKKIKKGINGGKLYKMAWTNIVKNKRKVALSLISISLSSIILIFVINIFMGLDENVHANVQMTCDFQIVNDISHNNSGEYIPINDDIYNKVSKLDFIKNIKKYYKLINPEENGQYYFFNGEMLNEGKIKDEFKSYGNPQEKFLGFHYNGKGNISTDISTIKGDDLIEETSRLRVIDGELNKEKFKEGNYIILFRDDKGVLKAGDKVPISFVIRDEKGNEKIVKEEFTIMAIVGYPLKNSQHNWIANNLGKITLEENKFKSLFPNYKNYVQNISIDLKEGNNLKDVNDVISKIVINSGNRQLSVRSKYFYIEGVKEIKHVVTIIGIIIFVILGVIGLMNVINTILTGVFSRKEEFAVFEAIGMTKKQIKKMMIFEGIYYTSLSSILIIPLGFLVSLLAPAIFPIYGTFNFLIYGVSVFSMIIIIGIFIICTELIGYQIMSKDSIIERLRKSE